MSTPPALRSVQLLRTAPASLDRATASNVRRYVDGKPVSRARFDDIRQAAQRMDTFRTVRHGNRWRFYSVAYL